MKNFTITQIDLSNPNLQPLANDAGMDENETLVFEKLLTMSRKCNISFNIIEVG